MNVLIDNARIADLFGTCLERGHVIVEAGRIARVGEGASPAVPELKRLDAAGRLLTPGLVNAHAHLYSSLARGVPLAAFSPSGFREILEQLWWKLDRALDARSVYVSAQVGALALLRSGVTAMFDHHASPVAIEGSLSQLKRGLKEVGLRASVCYEITDRGGAAERDAGLAENVRFAQEEREPGRFAAHMGLHASFTLSDETLAKAAAASEELGLSVHMHLAEGKEDPVDALQRQGTRTAERLDRHGLLGEGALLAHGIHLAQAEVELLAERRGSVIHNPRSNMNNAVGAAKVSAMHARGVPIGLGTDGFGTSVIEEALCARLLAHHVEGSPTALGDDVLLDILGHNYTLAGRLFEVPMGHMKQGYAADLVLWDYDPPTPMEGPSVLGHLLFAAISEGLRPHGVLIAGEPVYWDGAHRTLEEHAVLAQSRETARALWSRMR